MGCYNFLKVMDVWGTCQDILGCDGTTLLGKKSIKQDSDPKFAWCATCREHLYFVTGFGLECGGMEAVQLGVSCVNIRNSIVYFVT